jgi:hypothetical protein
MVVARPDSAKRKEECLNRKRKCTLPRAPRHLGPTGLSGEAAAYGEERVSAGGPGLVSPDPSKN